MKLHHFATARMLAGVALALTLAASAPAALAQDGYKVGEGGSNPAPATGSAPAQSGSRFARIEYISGSVTWRPDANSDWKNAKTLTSLKPGAQLWATGSGRAEIRFDDGAVVRLGQGATVTLQTLYTDANGGFTRLSVDNGAASLNLRATRGVYQLDLPLFSVAASGPTRLNVRTEKDSRVIVRAGKATVQGAKGNVKLSAGDTLTLANPDSAYVVRTAPAPDAWDRWNDERDYLLPRVSSPAGAVIVPTIILEGRFGRHHDGDGYRRHW
jgi:FecR protein